jgi:cytidylate kinase
MGKVITIDGPAASGKTSVSRELARRLGWKWVSTGAFYRALAYVAQQKGVPWENPEDLANLVSDKAWAVDLGVERTGVILDGKDVTEEIYAEEIGGGASQVSQYPEVRKALLQAQRDLALVTDLVAEGRDCGTVVFPEANLKIYLTARSEQRAQRRATEKGADVDKIQAQQKDRDARDSGRKAAPLKVPEGASVIDTGPLNLEQVVDKVEECVRQADLV